MLFVPELNYLVYSGGGGGGEGTPYILMIGMIVFLGVVIGGLVFFRGCSSEFY